MLDLFNTLYNTVSHPKETVYKLNFLFVQFKVSVHEIKIVEVVMFKEIQVQYALEKEIQPDNTSVISIDAYDGCQLQCPYCFQMDNKEWSRNIYIRTNIADVLKKELQGLKNQGKELYIGSLSDPYMDIEKEYKLTRSILEVLKDTNHKVFITSKSVNGLILRDLDLFQTFKIKPVILLGLSHIEEANKGAAHRNIHIANQLHEAGINVRVFITPVLPYVMDIEKMLKALYQDIPIYLDKLRVFEQGNQNLKIYEWIKREYPTYVEVYSKIIFSRDEEYYFDLLQKYRNNKRITFMSELWNED